MAQPSPAALLPDSRGIVIYGGDFQNNAFADAWILRAAASAGAKRRDQ